MKKKGTKCKYIESTNLSQFKKNKLMKHSEHHTLKHIKYMVGLLQKGVNFKESHNKAQNLVGR